MDMYRLSMAGISAGEGLARFSGNAALYEKYLKRFPGDESFAAMCAAIDAGDAGAAFDAAHTLKGITGNLSMTRLYGDLGPLVEALRRGDLAGADALLKPVTEDYDGIISALSQP